MKKLNKDIFDIFNKEDKNNNYLHITLSFGEREVDKNVIISAYDEYKKT